MSEAEMANLMEPGAREVRLRQWQSLKDIRAEGLRLEMQQYVADQKDKNFTRAVLSALQGNIQDAHAAKAAALSEAQQSKLDCNAAQEASNVGTQDLQNVQRQLNEKTIECESLEGSLQDALGQAFLAINDAEMWQGAYQQTVSADLERENGKLLCDNRELRAEVKRAQAATERADRRLEANVHNRRNAERVHDQQLKQKKQKYAERAKRAEKARLQATRRAERAKTRAGDSSAECARLKQELLTLQAQLNERQQAESVHVVAPPASQQSACTTTTAAVASEPSPAEAVLSCRHVATPLEVSAAAAAGHVTGATALLAGEPMASPMMLDGLDVVSALRSPASLPLTAAASNGPAAPVGEDAASPTSMAGFGSPTASPSSTTAAAITAAVLGDETAELADPDRILPEEPSTRLHMMAPAGPQDSSMPTLCSDIMSPVGGTGPESGTPGLAAVIASSPPVSAGPVGQPHAGPPADPAVSVEAGFGSPIATAAPTTAAVANVAPAEDKAAPRRPALCPIAIKLGSRDCLQSGEGILTPSHPGALAQVNYRTPPSGEWAVFNSAASSDRAYQAQANRRAAQEAAAEAARASGLPNGSVLGVVSPRGGHSLQDTPKLLQADRQVLDERYISSSGQEQGKLMSMALDGVQQHPSPAGTPKDGSVFTTAAAGPGLGMHGVSIQSRGQGQMPTGASPGPPAQDKAASRQAIIINLGNWSLPQPGDGFVTPSLPGASAQGNYKTPPSGEWAVYDNVASSDCAYQAQAARRVLQGADAEAARVPGGANGSALGVVSPGGGGHTPQNTPDFLAMVFSNELFEPEAGTQVLEEAHVSRSGQDLGRLRVLSLDGVAQQPGPAGTPGDGISFSTPAASSAVGVHGTSMQSHGGSIQSHGGGQMPTGISPGAQGNDVMMTPDLWLPGMSLDGVAQQPSSAGIPRDESALSTPATGVIPGHGNMSIGAHCWGHMPTALSPGYVMTTPDFYLPVLTPLSSTPLSQHSQDFVPHQDSAANEGNLSPSQLHCSNRQRRTPREDASLSNDAAAPRQAAAMQPTLQLGKLTGLNPFTMGVGQPNKRAADQTGKKGKPARMAGANIQRTPGASKPAHAMAPSSSSSSLPLKGGGQSGAAPARPSLLEPTGAAQQLAPAAQRSAQTLSLRSETPSPDQAQMSTDAVDAAAQKHTSFSRHPTDGTHRPGVVSNNAAEVHTAGVNTSEHQQAGMPLLRPGWGKPPRFPGTGLTRHQKRSRTDTTCQAETDGSSPSDEPRLKQHKPSAGEKDLGQQAPASNGHSTAGEEEVNRQVAGGGEEQGEEAVVGHSKEQGAYSFTEGTAQLKAHRSQRDQPNSAKLKKRGGNVAPFMHVGLLSPKSSW
ncbi:hypothetical protein WJX77_008429 [Trebouxia sp. C0004]